MEKELLPVWEKVNFWIHDGGHIEHVQYMCKNVLNPKVIMYIYNDGMDSAVYEDIFEEEQKYDKESDALLAQLLYFKQRVKEAETAFIAAIDKEEKDET